MMKNGSVPLAIASGKADVRRLMRNIFFAGKETHHRPAFLRNVIANRSAQCIGYFAFQRVENGARRDRAIQIELHFIADARQRAQMMRQNDANHWSVCTSTERPRANRARSHSTYRRESAEQ